MIALDLLNVLCSNFEERNFCELCHELSKSLALVINLLWTLLEIIERKKISLQSFEVDFYFLSPTLARKNKNKQLHKEYFLFNNQMNIIPNRFAHTREMMEIFHIKYGH